MRAVLADEVACPAPSKARADAVWAPASSALAYTRALYGASVSLSTRLSSTQKSTWSTPWSSSAVAVSVRLRPLLIERLRSTVGGAPAGVPGSPPPGSATVHDALAPGDSTLPAASRERTTNVCAPSPSPDSWCGLVHATHASSSSRHSEVAPSSSTVNAIVAVLESEVSEGAEVIAVCGALVSTVN